MDTPFMPRKTSLFLLAATCAPLLALPLATPAEAGPVQRRLESLGVNVPVPARRPQTPVAEQPAGGEAEDNGDDAAPQSAGQSDAPAPALSGETKSQTPATHTTEATVEEDAEEPPVIPPVKPPETKVPADAPPLPEDPANAPALSEPTCIEKLREIAEIDVSDQPLDADGACVVVEPVILKATKGEYGVRFTDGLLLSCPFAMRVAAFTADTIQPLARHHIGAKLTMLGSGKGFVCRRRNGGSSNKWSEHSFGKAIDIVSFSFDGKAPLAVRDTAEMNDAPATFLTAVRKAACGTFTTVLGPGSNAAHATHLHLDTARMSPEKKNPYRICE